MTDQLKPSQTEIQKALDTLEAAGFEVIDGRRVKVFQQTRRPAYIKAIKEAKSGDHEAAKQLIKWAAQDLQRPPWWLMNNPEIYKYLGDVMLKISNGQDPSNALNLKTNHRQKSREVKDRKRRAIHLYRGLRENLSDKDAISDLPDMLGNKDERSTRRDIAAGKTETEEFEAIKESCRSSSDNKPVGVIVIM